jgi:hypothetical protein
MLGTSGAVPLLLLYAFMIWTGTNLSIRRVPKECRLLVGNPYRNSPFWMLVIGMTLNVK